MRDTQTNSIEQLLLDSGVACAYARIYQQADKIPLKMASDFVTYIQKLIEDPAIQAQLNLFNTDTPLSLAKQFIQIIKDNTPKSFNQIRDNLNEYALIKKIEEHFKKIDQRQTLDIVKIFRKIWESESLQTGLLIELKKIKGLHEHWENQLKQTENLFDIKPSELIDYFSNIGLSNVFNRTKLSLAPNAYNAVFRATKGETRTKLHMCYLGNILIERFNHSTTSMIVSESRDFAIIMELHKQVMLFWNALVKYLLEPLITKQAHKVNPAYLSRARIATKEAIVKLKKQTRTRDTKSLIEQVTLMLEHDGRKLSQRTPLPKALTIITFQPADAHHFSTLQTTISYYRSGSMSAPDPIRMRYFSRLFTSTPPNAQKKPLSPEPATPTGRTHSVSFCF